MRPQLSVSSLFLTITIATGCSSGPEWTDFERSAEAVCSQGNEAIAALGPVPMEGTRGVSPYAFSLAAIQERVARRLAELEIPKDGRKVFLQWVARLESLIGKSREYGAEIRAGRSSFDGEMREAAIDAQNAALNLGLTECTRFGLP